MYFTGRLGFSKVLLFKDDKASEGSDNPVWNVLLQETEYNPEQKTQSAPLTKEQEVQRGIEAQVPLNSEPDLNDEIPF